MQLKSQAAAESGEAAAVAEDSHANIWESEGLLAHTMGISNLKQSSHRLKLLAPRISLRQRTFLAVPAKDVSQTAALIAKSTRASVILAGCGADAVAKANVSASVARRCVESEMQPRIRRSGYRLPTRRRPPRFPVHLAAFGKPSVAARIFA